MSHLRAHSLRAAIQTYAWRYYLVLGMIAVFVYGWLPSLTALNLYYDVLVSSTIVAIGSGIWVHNPPQRLPWYCFLLYLVLTSFGNLIWDYYELVLHIESPFPSVADVLYLAGYLPFTLGMLLLVQRRVQSGDIGSVIDAAMVTVSAGMLGWVYLMAPYIHDATLTWVEQVVSITYPLMDVFLVAIIAHILLSPGPRPLAYTFLAWSLSLILGADTGYAIMTLNETYSTGRFIDYGWLFGYVNIGVAALHPSMRALSALPPAPPVKFTIRRLIVLAVASLLGPAALTVELVRGQPVNVLVILGGSAVLFLLSLTRMHNLILMLQATMAQLETTLSNLRSALQNYQQVEALLSHQAFHDSLTHLPNRAMFKDRLQRALAAARRRQHAVAVLFLDLDEFKYVNDRFGHQVGDELLILLAQRLQTSVRPEDTPARLGGDEFTVLLEQLTDIGGALQVAERIIADLHAPFVVGDRRLVVTASIGIAWSSTGQEPVDEILRQADVAMYRAKAQGKACYALYDPAMNARALQRLDLEVALRHAIEAQEFQVYYQPKVDLTTGQLVGLEALIRWHQPEQGMISPATFIPIAEETRLILPIGRWVLEQACAQAYTWNQQRQAGPPIRISVNLSARQFQHPGLVEEIRHILHTTQLPAHLLALEITESMIMEKVDEVITTLHELKQLGVQIWIDDFGTGYSSLSYLTSFPVDTLKIDKSFVDGLGRSAEDTAIVRAVITLAHTLGMSVIAEGVETFEQATQLRMLGCEVGQGYYFARPLPAAEVEPLIYQSDQLAASESYPINRKQPITYSNQVGISGRDEPAAQLSVSGPE